ncbi:transcription-repair coupling factor [bacterium]|nr:transcription-repair coupling factor [bacterium]
MSLEVLQFSLQKNEEFRKAVDCILKESSVNISVSTVFRSFFLASLFKSLGKPLLLITAHAERAEEFYKDMGNFISSDTLRYFPSWETFAFEQLSPNRELVGDRMEVLYSLNKNSLLVITSLHAVLQRIAPPSEKLFTPTLLKVGDQVDFSRVLEELVRKGYSRNYMVEGRGEFSARGGIIDVYPAAGEHPLRIEFFGDEVESIRAFDLSSQLSVRDIKEATIFPCREVVLTKDLVEKAEMHLKKMAQDKISKEELQKLKELIYFEGAERYLPFFYPHLATFLDYFPQEGVIVLDEPKELKDAAHSLYEQQRKYFDEAFWGKVAIADISSYYASWEELSGKRKQKMVSLTSLFEANDSSPIANFNVETVEPILGKFERLEKLIAELDNEGYRVVLVLESESQGQRVTDILKDHKFNAHFQPQKPKPASNSVVITHGKLTRGFIAPFLKLALLNESDIFKPRRKRRQEKQTTTYLPISSFADLKLGDYVVHVNHGIGRFSGLTTQEVAGMVRDYLLIEYAKGAKLYVPSDQMHRIQKYIGAGAEPPRLTHLGGRDWAHTKKRVRESVKSLAIDLLQLYSQRMKVKGFSFSPDTVWQRELEDAFPFDETPDQMKAIENVKEDMEKLRPMDRLICGDVGYGKTEVALRAAFKAIMDGKQVIVLVPTTILAQQHYATFSDRLNTFPVYVNVLSRFKNYREQKEILNRLKEGKVDIVIGTHRLLQKDVDFKDPGLVIVDEEQRFGVAHKEQLKELRKNVDVLTLTATPIPRTLQMSLSGVRDLSIIDTPPEDRYPVFTYVGEFDENMVALAIRRELARDGQVFYVNNRVQIIESAARYVSSLVPEARIAVAHGQMPERGLEKVMQDFIGHKCDVLVCTTIIESGLDMPNVNTLIVTQAERFGLSTLYQLRGRVGRAHHRAYAYFFFSPAQNLTSGARERLKTISEFTELGSGLKIALRDLEIRGAGNLLGPEQHGHMAAVGFELYCQLLKEAVDELRGETLEEFPEIKVELSVSAYIPSSYIPEETLRIEAYRKIAAIDVPEKRQKIERELRDRYGPLPREAGDLLQICDLKILAKERGIREVVQEREKVALRPVRLTPSLEKKLSSRYRDIIFKPSRQSLVVRIPDGKYLLKFLHQLISDIII